MSDKVQERAIVRWGVADGQLTNGQRWMSFACLFFLGFISMYSFLKVSPVLMIVGESLGMGLDSVGNIMALFNIAGIVIAFPVVWIMRNFGIKFSLVVTAAVSLIGSLLGIYADGMHDAGMFLFSRVLEGAGMGMIAAIGPNVMPRLFPAKRMGLVMGLWSVWTCPGILMATIIGPQIFAATGNVMSLWWVSVVMEVIALVWLLISCKMNKENENEIAAREAGPDNAPKKQRNFVVSATIASLSFLGYCALFGMFQNFYPTFLQGAAGMDIAASAMPATVSTLVTVVISIFAGIFISKYNLRKTALIVGHALLAVTMGWIAWIANGEFAYLTAVLVGAVAGFLPVSLRLIIPMQVTDTRKMDYILCIMACVTNLGSFYSGPFGAMAASMGWIDAGLYGLLPIGIAMAVICLIFVKGDRKVIESDNEPASPATDNAA